MSRFNRLLLSALILTPLCASANESTLDVSVQDTTITARDPAPQPLPTPEGLSFRDYAFASERQDQPRLQKYFSPDPLSNNGPGGLGYARLNR